MSAKGELADFYKTNFLLAKEHNISLTEIDNMLPFERTIYIGILLEYLENKKKALERH